MTKAPISLIPSKARYSPSQRSAATARLVKAIYWADGDLQQKIVSRRYGD